MKRVALMMAALLSLVVAAALAVSGAMAQGTVGGSQTVGLVTMNAQNGSGESGSATLTEVNGQVMVTLNVSNGTTEPQPAHVHKGTCANLDPVPAYPLNSVVNGTSQTIVDVTLGTLMSQPFAINVHKSAAEITTYVSCGDLTMMARAGGTNPGTGGGITPGMPSTGNGGQGVLIIVLGLLSLGLVATGVGLAHRRTTHL